MCVCVSLYVCVCVCWCVAPDSPSLKRSSLWSSGSLTRVLYAGSFPSILTWNCSEQHTDTWCIKSLINNCHQQHTSIFFLSWCDISMINIYAWLEMPHCGCLTLPKQVMFQSTYFFSTYFFPDSWWQWDLWSLKSEVKSWRKSLKVNFRFPVQEAKTHVFVRPR